jgi:magnesium transporter
MPEKEKHIRAVIDVDDELLDDIRSLIESDSKPMLINILSDIYPADIALIIENLKDEEGIYLFRLLEKETASETLLELNDYHRDVYLDSINPHEISSLVGEMDSDDAADIISDLDEDIAADVLSRMDEEDSTDVKELMRYEENTAGGIMAKEYISVNTNDNIGQAIKRIKENEKDIEELYYIWVTDEQNKLAGIISLKDILLNVETPGVLISDIMNTEVISCSIDTDQEEVARLFSKYDLVTMPVVDNNNHLAGSIMIDDIVDVLEEEYSEDVAKIVGSDVDEIQSKSPFQIAVMRLPWVLITLAIQFFAGVVIHLYDDTLTKVILLASFMPIISAISGNTGLQASAITVRALATGHLSENRWSEPIKRSLLISVMIGFSCGLVIGMIAYFWSKNPVFSVVVAVSMFISINISAFIGTSMPFISKKMGFDPAITVGPFETAFQDVVGITVFLTLATISLKWLI